MAGLGRRTFAPGEVLTASNVMNYLQDQAVMNFAGTAARGSAIGSAVSQGMVSYLQDSSELQVYKTVGTAIAGWEPVNLAQSPNFIINGAFEINQRAFTSRTTNGYGFDRWFFDTNTGTVTHSAQDFTLGAAPIPGLESRNFARVVTSGQSGAGAIALISQGIESVRSLAGQTYTISFYARAGSGTPKIAVASQQYFGTGGSPSATVTAHVGQVTLSTSWARYSITATLDSLTGKTIGTNNNDALYFQIWVSAGTDFNARTGSLGIQNNTFDIWGVQVEQGQTATPFRRNANSIQGELAACQRYYYQWNATSTYNTIGNGYSVAGTTAYGTIHLPVRLRVKPTSVVASGTFNFVEAQTGVYGSSTAIAGYDFTTDSITLQLSGMTGMTAGRAGWFRNAAAGTEYFSVSAEL